MANPAAGGGPARLLGQGPPWVPNSRQTAFLIPQPLPSCRDPPSHFETEKETLKVYASGALRTLPCAVRDGGFLLHDSPCSTNKYKCLLSGADS